MKEMFEENKCNSLVKLGTEWGMQSVGCNVYVLVLVSYLWLCLLGTFCDDIICMFLAMLRPGLCPQKKKKKLSALVSTLWGGKCIGEKSHLVGLSAPKKTFQSKTKTLTEKSNALDAAGEEALYRCLMKYMPHVLKKRKLYTNCLHGAGIKSNDGWSPRMSFIYTGAKRATGSTLARLFKILNHIVLLLVRSCPEKLLSFFCVLIDDGCTI